jgi:hypothetical protein
MNWYHLYAAYCQGSTGLQAVPYFCSLGHACPSGFSAADFLADLISIDYG